MGTHPIFESDFDCLTDTLTNQNGEILRKFYVQEVLPSNGKAQY